MADQGRTYGRGFTLVELLVCVAVIGVLAAVLLPALAGARESGREAVCWSNQRQLVIGAGMYADDWRDALPPGSPERLANLVRWHGSRTSASGAFAPGGGTMTGYLGEEASRGVRACPGFGATLAALAERGIGFERSCGGYGYNNEYMGTQRRRTGPGVWEVASDRAGSARHAFGSPGATAAFADCGFASDEAAGVPGGVIEYSFVEPRFWPDYPGSRADPSVHFRHGGRGGARAGVAWMDGHVTGEGMGFSWSSGLYGVEARDVAVGWMRKDDDNSLFDYE